MWPKNHVGWPRNRVGWPKQNGGALEGGPVLLSAHSHVVQLPYMDDHMIWDVVFTAVGNGACLPPTWMTHQRLCHCVLLRADLEPALNLEHEPAGVLGSIPGAPSTQLLRST